MTAFDNGRHEMIDTTAETILTLAHAADELPRRRRGRKTNISTLYRWSQVGCRGIRLETIQIGGTRCTSREALQRFFERLSQAQGASPAAGGESSPAPAPARRSVIRRQRDSERAAARLQSLGA
jgi:Protein of unknown function (DUF1580)